MQNDVGINFMNCTIGVTHVTETLKDLDLNASAEDFIKKIKKEKTRRAVADKKEKPRLQKANKGDQKPEEEEEAADWTHAKRKMPPSSEDLGELMERTRRSRRRR